MEKVLIIALAFFAIVIFFKCVRVVPQADNWVVERLGKYVATLNPGLNLINPLLSRISKKVDIRERVLDMPRQGIITSDNAILEVDGVVYFKVMDPYKSFYGIQDLEWAIMNLAQTTLRSIMGKMTLDESLSLREKINKELLIVLDDATDSWGTKITRVELKDIAPPAELAKAMALQLKAERERRARVLEAEAKKNTGMNWLVSSMTEKLVLWELLLPIRGGKCHFKAQSNLENPLDIYGFQVLDSEEFMACLKQIAKKK